MRQLMYASVSTVPSPLLLQILEQSRHNNAIDGITGMLWSDGERYLQVLEGGPDAVGETYRRIERDDRHRDIQVLLDHDVAEREFGGWSMALRRSDESADAFDVRVRQVFARVSPAVRERYQDLVALA